MDMWLLIVGGIAIALFLVLVVIALVDSATLRGWMHPPQ